MITKKFTFFTLSFFSALLLMVVVVFGDTPQDAHSLIVYDGVSVVDNKVLYQKGADDLIVSLKFLSILSLPKSSRFLHNRQVMPERSFVLSFDSSTIQLVFDDKRLDVDLPDPWYQTSVGSKKIRLLCWVDSNLLYKGSVLYERQFI